MADLWAEAHDALSCHKWGEEGNTDPQSFLNRVADKFITGYEDPNFDLRPVELSIQVIVILRNKISF
jgi:hypothetical protein